MRVFEYNGHLTYTLAIENEKILEARKLDKTTNTTLLGNRSSDTILLLPTSNQFSWGSPILLRTT
jgi:hypothetical protein